MSGGGHQMAAHGPCRPRTVELGGLLSHATLTLRGIADRMACDP